MVERWLRAKYSESCGDDLATGKVSGLSKVIFKIPSLEEETSSDSLKLDDTRRVTFNPEAEALLVPTAKEIKGPWWKSTPDLWTSVNVEKRRQVEIRSEVYDHIKTTRLTEGRILTPKQALKELYQISNSPTSDDL